MFCLDTNIVIFALNQRKPHIRTRLKAERAAGTALLLPTIVLFELEYGIAKSNKTARSAAVLSEFVGSGFSLLDFDADDAREAGEVRATLEKQGTPIGPYDVLIAAQARRRGAVLVSLNRREFERVPGLMVTDWAT
jgi:tRNA(fMet)-specific endonuclease VapC